MNRTGIALRLLACVGILGAAEASPPASPTTGHERVHENAAALEQAVLDSVVAYIHDDAESLVDALRRIEAGCRRIGSNEIVPYPPKVVAHDRALHNALDFVRQHARDGKLDDSLQEFRWILRGCRTCHTLSRQNGIRVRSGADPATSSSPSDTENPSPPSASKPSR